MTVKVSFKPIFFCGLWKNGKVITRFAMNFLPCWRGDGCWSRAVALGEQVELGWGVGFLAWESADPWCTIRVPRGLKLYGCMMSEKGLFWVFFSILKIEGLCSSTFSFKISISSYEAGVDSQGVNLGWLEARFLLLLLNCLRLWEGKV